MWREAREHLEAASGTNPSARICRYMAELVEAENGDVERSREWLRQASMSEPDRAWVCDDCGNTVGEWKPICGQCEKFDSLLWKAPARVTRIDNNENGGDATQTLDSDLHRVSNNKTFDSKN